MVSHALQASENEAETGASKCRVQHCHLHQRLADAQVTHQGKGQPEVHFYVDVSSIMHSMQRIQSASSTTFIHNDATWILHANILDRTCWLACASVIHPLSTSPSAPTCMQRRSWNLCMQGQRQLCNPNSDTLSAGLFIEAQLHYCMLACARLRLSMV